MPGYSGTPLVKKLGFKPPLTLVALNAPAEYSSWLGDLPGGVQIVSKPGRRIVAAHLFSTRRAELAKTLASLRDRLDPAGFVWVSWPKKASKVPTDITEDVIRDVCLPMGLVDVKVCAIDETWSGLKLVVRLQNRPARGQ